MADSTIILEETLTVSPSFGPRSSSKKLNAIISFADQVAKRFDLRSYTAGWWLYLTDAIFLKPTKNVSETMGLADQVLAYKSFKHETWKVELYRAGSLLDIDQANIRSFNFTKVLSDEVGSGEIVFENSDALDYREGDEIRIYYGSEDSGLYKLIFTGEIDLAERFWDEEEAEQNLKLSYQDYGKLLLEKKVTDSFPTVTLINSIITSLLSGLISPHSPVYANERAIDISDLYPYTATRTVDFVGEALWDCLSKLAFITKSEFYVDQDKKLQFFPRTSALPVVATLTIDEFENYNYERRDDNLVNTLKVYGHQNKILPVPSIGDPDPWCEYADLGLWTVNQGAKYADTIAVRAGTYSIANDNLGPSTLALNLAITFPSIVDLSRKESYKELVFSGKIISGSSLTAFPQAELEFELYDQNSNKMSYPAEQVFDLLKVTSPSEANTLTSASAHTVSTTTYGGAHDGATITCLANERIALNYVREIIRNRWYGVAGYSKITYQFASGPIGTITVDDVTSDPSPVPDPKTNSNEVWSNPTTWEAALLTDITADDAWTRVRVTAVNAYLQPSCMAPIYGHLRFGLSYSGSTIVPLFGLEASHAGYIWFNDQASGEANGDPGETVTVYVERYKDIATNLGVKDLSITAYQCTTAEHEVKPNIYAVGGLGESLIVKFYMKSGSAGKDVISTNREIHYFKSSTLIPKNLTEVRIPVGPDAEIEGKWELDPSDSTFNWSRIMQLNIKANVYWNTDTTDWAKLIVDWLHFDRGKWYGVYSDSTSMADPSAGGYGIRFKEIFDETIYSDIAAQRWASEMIARYKDPIFYLKNVEGLMDNLEDWNPGDRFYISLPEENNSTFSFFLRRLYFEYDEEEGTMAELDFERIGAV